MKKIVVISDTHRNYSVLDKLLPIMEESDYVFHLGDHYSDAMRLFYRLKEKIYAVKGNCDGGGEDLVLEIEGVKILLTHGDRYGVKSSNLNLFFHAKEIGVSAVFYGHTHHSFIETVQGVTLINPGCMTKFEPNSYCYVVIHQGKLTAKIVEL